MLFKKFVTGIGYEILVSNMYIFLFILHIRIFHLYMIIIEEE
jgi:hypothetical protein